MPVYTDKEDRDASRTASHCAIDSDFMCNEIEAGKFAVYEEIEGYLFGYRLEDIRKIQTEGKICLLPVDTSTVADQLSARRIQHVVLYLNPHPENETDGKQLHRVASQLLAEVDR